MTIGEALVAVLEADGGVASRVGTAIYPLVVPDPVPAASITYTVAPGEGFDSQSGPSLARQDVITVSANVKTSYAGALELRAAVLAALEAAGEAWGTLSVPWVGSAEAEPAYDPDLEMFSAAVELTVNYYAEG